MGLSYSRWKDIGHEYKAFGFQAIGSLEQRAIGKGDPDILCLGARELLRTVH